MYDVITFGSAAQDIHIKSGAFRVLGKDICLPLGSKIDVEDIFFTSGGGGTNTAATFAKQGFKVAFYGAVGDDLAGEEIVDELKSLKIDTRFVVKKNEKKTNQSLIFSDYDRTILVYRGASDIIGEKDIEWERIKKSRWFYLAPLAGTFANIFGQLVDFGRQNGIKIAVNPSRQQLGFSKNVLWEAFHKIDILFLNQEEAALLEEKPDCLGPSIVVVTKGGEGVDVYSEQNHFFARPNPDRRVADTTGAGDAFASGFLSEYMRSNNIEKAIQYGMANSEANLAEIGAKTGLLSKGAKFNPVPVIKI